MATLCATVGEAARGRSPSLTPDDRGHRCVLLPELEVDFPLERGELSFHAHMAHLRAGLEELARALDRRKGEPIWRWDQGGLLLGKGPYLDWNLPTGGRSLLVRCLSRYRPGAVRFFMDIVTRSLSPSRPPSIQSAHGCEFRFADAPEPRWVWMELILRLESREDVEQARQSLPGLEREIGLGLQSKDHASRLLEIRGLSHDEKILAIQERITHFMAERPQQFSADLMQETQFFLAVSQDAFRILHEAKHLTRLILASYHFRRLAQARQGEGRRLIQVKILPTHLRKEGELRPVLGVMVAICSLHSHERFEEPHLIAAIAQLLPQARPIPGSYFFRSDRPSGLSVFYIDIESPAGALTMGQRTLLRQQLPSTVRQSIAELVPSMFMPRNEEEVMRHIVTLSQQLRFVSDAPQVVISFERQAGSSLIFTIVVLRLQRGAKPSMETLLANAAVLRGEWSLERRRCVGLLRKRHPKEASILRVTLPSEDYLRQDQSIDLVQARCAVTADLERIVGCFRDYNGGLLQQQRAVLERVIEGVGPLGRWERDLLETFFHAIWPGERRALLRPDCMARWFRDFLDLQRQADQFPDRLHMRYDERGSVCSAVAMVPEPHFRQCFKKWSQWVSQDRDSVAIQFQLAGFQVVGIFSTSLHRDWKAAWHAAFESR